MTFRILTVCTANICRSPVAQIFLTHALKTHSVQVDSAGTLALNGHSADQAMQTLLQDKGFGDLAEHRSQALLPSLIAKYDLLLCMEDEHLQWITQRSPTATAKVKLLGHWEQGRQVADPIGQNRLEYERSVLEIERLCLQWAHKLTDLGMCV